MSSIQAFLWRAWRAYLKTLPGAIMAILAAFLLGAFWPDSMGYGAHLWLVSSMAGYLVIFSSSLFAVFCVLFIICQPPTAGSDENSNERR